MSNLEHDLHIVGMDCAACATTLEKGVGRLTGVQSCEVSFAAARMRVVGDVSAENIYERIRQLGYDVDTSDRTTAPNKPAQPAADNFEFIRFLLSRYATAAALVGCILMVAAFVSQLLQFPSTVSNALFLISAIIAGFPVARSGLRAAFINRDININLLMTIAALGAVAIGETGEGALTLCLFAIGEALQGYTTDHARRSIRSLMSLASTEATLLKPCMDCQEHMGQNGYTGGPCPWCGYHEELVSLNGLNVGDLILVKSGTRIPMDGTIRKGESSINQAPITGESMPVSKTPGSEVFAGSINGETALKVEVTRLATDNTLNRIIKMVEEAQSRKAPIQSKVDQFARFYTPAVVVIATLIAVIPPLLFHMPFYDEAGIHGWLYRALTLLVIACPCALVISTPVSIISAITSAARHGVLIKGGAILEELGKVTVFAFDKTGTLTQGKPTVQQVVTPECSEPGCDCQFSDNLLALAAAVERRATHPLAHAVASAATEHGVLDKLPPAEAVTTLVGRGVQGKVNGQTITIGNHRYFDTTYPHQATLCEAVQAAEERGYTVMMVHDGHQVRGFITVSDKARDTSKQAISEISHLPGVEKIIMLTGDSRTTAAQVADSVGIESVEANLLPEDKLNIIRHLVETNKSVAMIGDGINDTPALAAASVGIAMGGAGTAQALETADVALMADDLTQLPYTIALSQQARRVITQNITVSLGLKVFFLILTMAGLTSLWLAVLADVGTSLIVTFNGMQLLNFNRKDADDRVYPV